MISENYKLVIMIVIRFIQMGDGQKKTPKIGCVVISDNRCNIQRIPGGSSNLTAELKLLRNNEIVLCWSPSLIGITGNES